MSVRLLSAADVRKSITMLQAIDALEGAFIQLAKHQVQLPLRSGVTIEAQEALTLTMPGYLGADKVLGLKVVSFFPHNHAQGKPTIIGFVMLLDDETGEPVVLMDAGFLTALRTGAVSGLATKYFAVDDADHVAIVGSGTQAQAQLEAVAAVRPIKRVTVWSREIKNAQAFAKQYEHRFDIQAFESLSHVIRDAPIICTATASVEPLIYLPDLHPKVHINAVGSHAPGMQEISSEVLGQAIVVVDQLDAALAEAGEIINIVGNNVVNKSSIIEIGTWLLQKDKDYKQQLSVFKSVGLAIQDLCVANIVYQHALQHDLGTPFELH